VKGSILEIRIDPGGERRRPERRRRSVVFPAPLAGVGHLIIKVVKVCEIN
jgi:hypothetical protein